MDHKNSTSRKHGAKAEEFLLRKLFINELMRMYWAEKHLCSLLSRMSRRACSPDLASCFKGHLAATEEQVSRLQQIFHHLRLRPRAKKFVMMNQVISKARMIMRLNAKGTYLRDVALITLAGKVEYLELEKYYDLRQIADLLDEREASALLQETIDEEREAWESFEAVKQDIESEFSKTIEIAGEHMMPDEAEAEELEAS